MIKFEEVIKNTALMVNREDIIHYLNYEIDLTGEDTEPTLNLMTNLLNLVIRELAGTFIPMVKKENINAPMKKIYYTALEEQCIKVNSVYDEYGNEVNFSITPEYLQVGSDKVIVEYQYIPPNYYLQSEIGWTEEEISISALCYGLAAEYSICKGSFEEAVMWHERYVNAITNIRKVKNGKIKGRSFV